MDGRFIVVALDAIFHLADLTNCQKSKISREQGPGGGDFVETALLKE